MGSEPSALRPSRLCAKLDTQKSRDKSHEFFNIGPHISILRFKSALGYPWGTLWSRWGSLWCFPGARGRVPGRPFGTFVVHPVAPMASSWHPCAPQSAPERLPQGTYVPLSAPMARAKYSSGVPWCAAVPLSAPMPFTWHLSVVPSRPLDTLMIHCCCHCCHLWYLLASVGVPVFPSGRPAAFLEGASMISLWHTSPKMTAGQGWEGIYFSMLVAS